VPEELHPIHQAYAAALDAGGPAVIPVGRTVLCDACDADLTNDTRSGGFLFGSYAYGPCCEKRQLESIRGYHEEWNIRARCPEGVSFADWIRDLRGPDAAIMIEGGPPGTWRP
jgi:hypothetical protein